MFNDSTALQKIDDLITAWNPGYELDKSDHKSIKQLIRDLNNEVGSARPICRDAVKYLHALEKHVDAMAGTNNKSGFPHENHRAGALGQLLRLRMI